MISHAQCQIATANTIHNQHWFNTNAKKACTTFVLFIYSLAKTFHFVYLLQYILFITKWVNGLALIVNWKECIRTNGNTIGFSRNSLPKDSISTDWFVCLVFLRQCIQYTFNSQSMWFDRRICHTMYVWQWNSSKSSLCRHCISSSILQAYIN